MVEWATQHEPSLYGPLVGYAINTRHDKLPTFLYHDDNDKRKGQPMPPTESKHYHWNRIEFYAQRGLITIVDEDLAADAAADPHRAIQRVRPGDFMERALAIRMATGDKYPDEARKANRLLDEAKEVCKIAKAQGDPGDPKVQAHYRRHRRRSSALVLPSEADRILGPVGGPRFRIRLDEPRKMMLGGVQVVPDITLGPASMVTPAVAEQLRKPKGAAPK